MLWFLPSSQTPTDADLKVLVTERLEQHYEVSSGKFNEYLKIRTSCWILEHKGNNFYCDCPIGSKGHIHFVGLSYKLGILMMSDRNRLDKKEKVVDLQSFQNVYLV